MTRPATRHFIGPLTPAQRRRRERSRSEYDAAARIADARNVPLGDAFKLLRSRPQFVYHGYADGTYP